MSSKFGQIRHRSKELVALERLKIDVATFSRSLSVCLLRDPPIIYSAHPILDQLANLHFRFTSVPRCTPMTD